MLPFESVPAIDGAGATVHRIMPTSVVTHLDPFVALDDFHVASPAGFPTHPHRGFEAFTYMVDGSFHHRDNLGNVSVISTGGIQRFTSGRGAFHSEMPVGDGTSVGLQLWVNLPRRLKQMDPEYVGTPGEALPERAGDGLRIRTIVGEGSPAVLRTEVDYLDVLFERAARFEREIRAGSTCLVYVLSGAVEASGMQLAERQGAIVEPGLLRVEGVTGSRVAFLRGAPHHEPIHQHGPYVD